MRNILLAAAAVAVFATPAMARDGQPYVGIEGGMIIDGKLKQDVRVSNGIESFNYDNAFKVDLDRGLDADVIGGYDFGMFRLEGELGYKRLKSNNVRFSDEIINDTGFIDNNFDVDGRGRVISGMINGLVDFGNQDGLSFYGGIGLGRAGVKIEGDKDSAWAGQLIAGLRYAVSPNVDVGLKYRYFRTGRLSFEDSFDAGEGGFFDLRSRGRLTTHSLLASLIFNFGAPSVDLPPPPPPPPPAPEPVAPATQTCADGSVILATDMCPPPPPPPAPAPMPERG